MMPLLELTTMRSHSGSHDDDLEKGKEERVFLSSFKEVPMEEITKH